jgi:hypothetical protein
LKSAKTTPQQKSSPAFEPFTATSSDEEVDFQLDTSRLPLKLKVLMAHSVTVSCSKGKDPEFQKSGVLLCCEPDAAVYGQQYG